MKEKGFPLIESLMFDEHDLVKRAATECMCNMVLCEEVKCCHFHVNCDSVDKSFAFERGPLKVGCLDIQTNYLYHSLKEFI